MALSTALRARLSGRSSVSKSLGKYTADPADPIHARRNRKNKENIRRPLAARLLNNRGRRKKKRCSSSSTGSAVLSSIAVMRPQLKRTRSSNVSVFPRSTLRLREILRNEQFLTEFLCFCHSQYSAENLLFWLNAERFRLLADEEQAKRLGVALSKELVLTKAIELYNRFLKQDADEWVCLQTETIETISNCLLNSPENVCSELFKKAQAETLLTVENDIIPRFIKYAVLSDKFEIPKDLRQQIRMLLSQEVVCNS